MTDRTALHSFLCLDAPHLLPVAATAPEDRIEETLLAAVESGGAPWQNSTGQLIAPGFTAQDAAQLVRDALRVSIQGFFERQRLRLSIEPRERRLLLRTMLLTRAIDERLKRAFDRKDLRWGDHPSPQKGFRSWGQEAIVGAGLRLRRPPEAAPGRDYRGDVVSPLIRDLGLLLLFRPDAKHPFLAQFGLKGTPMDGRDLHTGDLDWGVLPPAAPLTIGIQTLVGLAYGFKLRGEDRVALGCIGDGGSSLGEWHESVNLAAAQRLPVVFVVQNNRWALGTHVSEQTAARRLAWRAAGYGIPGVTIFGNDPEEVAAACAWAAARARGGKGPALIELLTYRRSGHAHHDDDRFHGLPGTSGAPGTPGTPGVVGYEYETEALAWAAADPIDLFTRRLIAAREMTGQAIDSLRDEVGREADEAESQALAAPWPEPADYRERVYAPRRSPPVSTAPDAAATRRRRMAYDEAVRQALIEAMETDPSVFVLGEDVGGRYGGAFGVTRGLAKQFGAGRCVNLPIAEGAIVGCAVGAALEGLRPVVEIQFADFLASGFNALVNNAAKLHWRWGRPVPMVVRLPYGAATGTMNRLLGGGPYHSQCPEMWFLRNPGWKIVAPSTPADAKGLLLAAIRDDNPVLFLEAKALYGFFRQDLRQDVPLGVEHEVEIGRAAVRREGRHLTILTYGAMVWTALLAAEDLASQGIEAEVIDLRSLWPLDEAAIETSVRKTNRVLILHEDTRRGGMGGELGAILAEKLFFHLDAPLRRVTAPDTPVPYSPPLEYDFLPKKEDVVREALELVRI